MPALRPRKRIASLPPILLILAVFVAPAGAQTAASAVAAPLHPSSYRLSKSLLNRFTLDVGKAIAAPARWKGRDWARFGLASAAGLALFAYDDGLYGCVQDHMTPLSRDAFPVLTLAGDGGYLAGLLGLLYLGGEAFDSLPLRRTAVLGLESYVASGLVVLVIKAAVGRARPYAGEGPYSFHPLSFSGRNASFVSGHSASAFAVAAVVAGTTQSALVDALVYGLAGLVAISRIHESKHWPSDVLGGSLIGLFVGLKIVDLDGKRGKDGARLEWAAAAGFPGLGLSLRF